jgi:hypothetical protein
MFAAINLFLTGAANAIDSFFNNVTLLLSTGSTNGAQNNTFLDSSSNNFTITRNGNTTQGTFTPFSQTGWSDYFPGSGSYATVPASSDFAPGTGDFTVDGWIFTGSSTLQTIFSQTVSGTNYFVVEANAPTNRIQITTTASGGGTAITSAATLVLNSWNYFCVSRTSGTITVWCNGSAGTPTTNTNNLTNTTYVPTIGTYSHATTTNVLIGYLSNLRYLKGTAISGATVPTAPFATNTANQSLLTCASNSFADINTTLSAKTLTITGTPSVQAFFPFVPTSAYSTSVVGGSGYFDGSGDYLALPNNSIPLSNSDFTVELWVYPLTNTKVNIVGGQGDAATAAGTSFVFYINTANTSDVYVGSTSYSVTSPTVPINQWNHVAYVRTGGTFSSFLNGVRVGTVGTLGTSSVNAGSTTYPPCIGAYSNGTFFLNGYISGCRLIKGSGGYNAASSTITIPTAPPTAITNTAFLTNFTNAGIFDAAAKNDLETVGNAQVSTTQAKFGTTSMYFDGTGDYLLSPNTLSGNFGTGDFTVEFWFYCGAQSTSYATQIGTLDSATIANSWRFGTQLAGAAGVYFSYNNGTTTTDITFTTTNYNNSAWHYAAVTRSGTTVRAYIDGNQVGTNQTVSANFTARRIVVGAELYTPTYYNGYLDEIRVTTGFARYTGTTMTVPTSAVPVQ